MKRLAVIMFEGSFVCIDLAFRLSFSTGGGRLLRRFQKKEALLFYRIDGGK